MEIVSTSFLPRGSGMGSSSILGGCIISALAKCIGVQSQDEDVLIKRVLLLEQLLTTAGGWQDQVGGLIGGLKLGRTAAKLPLEISVQKIEIPIDVRQILNTRLLLAFTGQPRLARNILQNVLRRWAQRSPEIVKTVKALVEGANDSVQAIQERDFCRLGDQMSAYWEHKKAMAGKESGVEPPVVNMMLEILKEENIIVGGTLCGAGGGGFLALLLEEDKTIECVKNTLKEHRNDGLDISAFTWHRCEISEQGIQTIIQDQSDQAL